MFIHAKKELLSVLEALDIPIESITKARIGWLVDWEFEWRTISDTEELLDCLDKVYDSGYGTQQLDGDIVISKELWLSRREYDGSEVWWPHQCPNI